MAAEYVALIGRRIREAREAKGLTQAELAAEIPGKSDGTQMSKWERGIHRPSDDTLEHIARVLGRNVAWFLSEAPDKSKTPDPFQQPAAPETELDEIRASIRQLDAKLDQVLDRLKHQDVKTEVHRAFEDYASRLGPQIGKRPPRSRRNQGPQAEEPPAAA